MTLLLSADRDLVAPSDVAGGGEGPPVPLATPAVAPGSVAAESAAAGSVAAGLATKDRTDALLAALTQMAALSPRRQADVAVAARRSGLSVGADAMEAALDQLRSEGCIEPPLRLSDGGILVSVTVRGIEYLATTAYRHVAITLMSRGLV